MKKLHTQISFLFILLCTCILFQDCKKGAEDPQLSLRSRRARLEGSWHMKSGTAGITILNSKKPAFALGLVLSGGQASASETEGGGTPTLYLFPYTLSIDIKRDGTFTMSEMYGSNTLIARGKWDFLNGIGDAKKKEEVLFIIEGISNDKTTAHLFNKESIEFTYKIIGLRNKSLKLESGTKEYLNVNGDNVSYTGTYEFDQP